ncbi:flagellar motor protein MotB [Nitrosovibrio sp. Nv17]|uniref:flagellar motor protein MotB n=1 Tax=Nitrosovibrio sp. Nv17 TaxID=1855339 RepID=UPI0009089384|nr:flagellar motor protein MotB [Nitrosovibrio sp. Nv17]SFW32292.1 chemotaxis protein MotB [Nitrosovibrio sp. Nv17]
MAKPPRPIVVRKIQRRRSHHGGQWKIAYADFITAMMAFFLLLWLLSTSSKAELQGISEYFQTPLVMAARGSGGDRSILEGGGGDPTRRERRVQRNDSETPERPASLRRAQAELERLDRIRLEDLKRRLERLIESNLTMRQFRKQLLLDITTEGLRIQIVDDRNRPMFARASAELEPHTREILRELGGVLNEIPNRVSLSGHTDATPYASGEKYYSNWELSADRANASRRQLILGGMSEQKLMRVVGLGAAVPFDREDPFHAVNRRISVIVMNGRAAEALIREGGAVQDIKDHILADSRSSQAARRRSLERA